MSIIDLSPFTSRCCSNGPKITEVIVVAIINYNLKFGSVAGKLGDSTIHTHTYIHTTHAQYLCTYA